MVDRPMNGCDDDLDMTTSILKLCNIDYKYNHVIQSLCDYCSFLNSSIHQHGNLYRSFGVANCCGEGANWMGLGMAQGGGEELEGEKGEGASNARNTCIDPPPLGKLWYLRTVIYSNCHNHIHAELYLPYIQTSCYLTYLEFCGPCIFGDLQRILSWEEHIFRLFVILSIWNLLNLNGIIGFCGTYIFGNLQWILCWEKDRSSLQWE